MASWSHGPVATYCCAYTGMTARTRAADFCFLWCGLASYQSVRLNCEKQALSLEHIQSCQVVNLVNCLAYDHS
jgi:hypothetical protein